MATTILDPKLLGFWARCVREAQHLSQEALAEAAGIGWQSGCLSHVSAG